MYYLWVALGNIKISTTTQDFNKMASLHKLCTYIAFLHAKTKVFLTRPQTAQGSNHSDLECDVTFMP